MTPSPGFSLLRKVLEFQRTTMAQTDFNSLDEIVVKIAEEVREIQETPPDSPEREEEVGDLFFACINLARWLKVDPETALQRTFTKVRNRVAYIEGALAAQGKTLKDVTFEEKEALWQESKKQPKA